MLIVVSLTIVALVGFAITKRPAPTADNPAPEQYSDDEREAMQMSQLYRTAHLMRQKHIREQREG